MLDNQKKEIFPLKRAALCEIQRLVRQLSNQISSFRMETANIYVTLQNSRLFTHGILSSEGVSKLSFFILEQQWKYIALLLLESL